MQSEKMKKSRKKVDEVFDLKEQNTRLYFSREVLLVTIENFVQKLLKKDRKIEAVKNICDDFLLQIILAKGFLKEIDPDFVDTFFKTVNPFMKALRDDK